MKKQQEMECQIKQVSFFHLQTHTHNHTHAHTHITENTEKAQKDLNLTQLNDRSRVSVL